MKAISCLVALLLLASAFFNSAYAQGDCTINLNEAQKLYEKGQIEKIPDLLTGCLTSGFNRENKVTALRLLTLVYLYEDENVKAEDCFVQMLKKNPEYKVNPNVDPIEFIRLYNSFQTRPVFSIGVRLGAGLAMPRNLQTYTYGDFDGADSKFTFGNSTFICVNASYNITEKFGVSLEPTYVSYSFEFSENLGGYNTIDGTMKISSFDFPVLASYAFYQQGNTSFFGELGLSAGIIGSGDMEISRMFYGRENPDVTGASLDASAMLKKLKLSCVMGVGVKYHVTHGFLSVDARYDLGMTNVSNPDNRNLNANPELANKYRYMYNDYALSSLSLNIGYSYEIYIHKKK